MMKRFMEKVLKKQCADEEVIAEHASRKALAIWKLRRQLKRN